MKLLFFLLSLFNVNLRFQDVSVVVLLVFSFLPLQVEILLILTLIYFSLLNFRIEIISLSLFLLVSFLQLSFQYPGSFFINGTLYLLIDHLFVIQGFLVLVFSFGDYILKQMVLLLLWTHYILLVLALSVFHCCVLFHKLVFVVNLIGDLPFSILLHVYDILLFLLNFSYFMASYGLGLHHHHLVQLLSVIQSFLPFYDLVPLQGLLSSIQSLLLLQYFLLFLYNN